MVRGGPLQGMAWAGRPGGKGGGGRAGEVTRRIGKKRENRVPYNVRQKKDTFKKGAERRLEQKRRKEGRSRVNTQEKIGWHDSLHHAYPAGCCAGRRRSERNAQTAVASGGAGFCWALRQSRNEDLLGGRGLVEKALCPPRGG